MILTLAQTHRLWAESMEEHSRNRALPLCIRADQFLALQDAWTAQRSLVRGMSNPGRTWFCGITPSPVLLWSTFFNVRWL